MTINKLSNTIKNNADNIKFADVIELIESLYHFTETTFTNGSQNNNAGENNGSCKIFAFAKLQNFNEEETLACFGEYYQEVKNTPDATNHPNIRQFMQHGWSGVIFQSNALTAK